MFNYWATSEVRAGTQAVTPGKSNSDHDRRPSFRVTHKFIVTNPGNKKYQLQVGSNLKLIKTHQVTIIRLFNCQMQLHKLKLTIPYPDLSNISEALATHHNDGPLRSRSLLQMSDQMGGRELTLLNIPRISTFLPDSNDVV